jgi:hypothetical protein
VYEKEWDDEWESALFHIHWVSLVRRVDGIIMGLVDE